MRQTLVPKGTLFDQPFRGVWFPLEYLDPQQGLYFSATLTNYGLVDKVAGEKVATWGSRYKPTQQAAAFVARNSEDYVSVMPATCPAGAELSAQPYVNQFGNPKMNYTCTLCPMGKFKFLDTPTPCTFCEAGKFTDAKGETACQMCQVGFEAVDGLTCRACQPSFYKREAAATSCSPCGAGLFSNESAQSDCKFCSPGYFSLPPSCPVATFFPFCLERFPFKLNQPNMDALFLPTNIHWASEARLD